jgi:glycosyltransferase involved in cell wall biosynthesis
LVGIYSPYEYSLGGGENYLSKIMNYFINKDYFVIFFNYTEFNKTRNLLNYYLNYNSQYVLNIPNKFIIDSNFRDKIHGLFDYFIFMSNISLPSIKGIGKKNIYHCQFPFDLNSSYNVIPELIENKTINSYNNIIVNSEFTHKYLLDVYNKYNIQYDINNIKVVYPVCIDTVNTYKYEKQNYSFVMIGRIFEYSTDANNKHFDKMIKILSDFTDFNYELNIIGSVKSEKWYNYLMQLIRDNNKIKIHCDISEDEKNDIIQNSKYFVQLTGFEENKISNEEHFGISIIEGINYNCIPISYNGGYPPYYIKNNENGYVVNNYEELKILIYNILNNNEIVDYNNFNNSDFNLNKFTYDSFTKSLDEIM